MLNSRRWPSWKNGSEDRIRIRAIGSWNSYWNWSERSERKTRGCSKSLEVTTEANTKQTYLKSYSVRNILVSCLTKNELNLKLSQEDYYPPLLKNIAGKQWLRGLNSAYRVTLPFNIRLKFVLFLQRKDKRRRSVEGHDMTAWSIFTIKQLEFERCSNAHWRLKNTTWSDSCSPKIDFWIKWG